MTPRHVRIMLRARTPSDASLAFDDKDSGFADEAGEVLVARRRRFRTPSSVSPSPRRPLSSATRTELPGRGLVCKSLP